VNQVPITLWRQVHQISHPDATYVWEQIEWFFSRPAPGEICTSLRGCGHRRLEAEPVEVLTPAMSFVERGRLLIVGDRECGHPAELVAALAEKEIGDYAMASKKSKNTGPSLFDAFGPSPAAKAERQPLTLREVIEAERREAAAANGIISAAPYSRNTPTVSPTAPIVSPDAAPAVPEELPGPVVDPSPALEPRMAPFRYIARGPGLTALVDQPAGWQPAPVRWPEARLADVLADVLVRVGQSDWAAICEEVEDAARRCPDAARVVGQRLAQVREAKAC
jgi:hypothetical protein